MTTWHCDKCSLRFGTYADFGDHWRTDHRKDPITERIVSAWQDTPRPDDFTSLPDKRLHCTRCDFTDVLTGDWFTDGGTMIQHMEDAHTPHAVEGIVQPNSASSGAALQVSHSLGAFFISFRLSHTGVPVSATDGYTLSTEQVRNMIGRAPVEGLRDWRIEFDRWLAAERAKATAQALTDAAAFLFDELSEEFTRGQRDFVRGLLLGEAAKFEQEVQ